MTQTRFLLVALLTLVVGTVSIRTQTPAAQDVRGLLQAVAKNMGTDTLKTLQYTASGMIAAPGQAFDPAKGAKPPATAPEGVVALGQLIRQNRLNVAQHVPIHGRPGTHEEFMRTLGDKVPPDSHGPLILPTTSPTKITSRN